MEMRSINGIRTIFFILLALLYAKLAATSQNEKTDLDLDFEQEPVNPLLCQEDEDCENEDMICGPNRLCLCYDYEKTTYDPLKDLCAHKVGKRCKSTDECVTNALCDPVRQICTCNGTDFSVTSAGKCLANFGVVCGGGCNPEKHLSCRAGHCDCVNPAQQGYSKKEGRCIALPEEKCELKIYYSSQIRLHCGNHATCLARNPQGEEDSSSRMHIGDEEFIGTCHCDQGYAHAESGNPDCKAKYGTPCNSTDPCAPDHHIFCDTTQGICRCDPPALEEMSQQSCALREGTPCINEEKFKSICTQNAICNDMSGKCQCKFGYSRTPSGFCKLDFDLMTCSSEKDNCNEFQGLTCIGDKCGCRFPQIFDKVLKICVNPVGGHCGAQAEKCPNNAFCNFQAGECECKRPLMPKAKKSDGFCYPGFGAPCTPSTSCSGGNYLTCNAEDSICECTSNALLENSTCFLRVNQKCRKDKEDTCVSRAICDESEGICECVKGYATDHGQCGLIQGKSCNPSANECNKEAFLSCLKSKDEYKCECNADLGLIYDQSLKSCAILVGSKCEEEYYIGPRCVENSNCESNVCRCSQGFKTNGSLCEIMDKDSQNSNFIQGESTERVNSIGASLKIARIQLFISICLLKSLVF